MIIQVAHLQNIFSDTYKLHLNFDKGVVSVGKLVRIIARMALNLDKLFSYEGDWIWSYGSEYDYIKCRNLFLILKKYYPAELQRITRMEKERLAREAPGLINFNYSSARNLSNAFAINR